MDSDEAQSYRPNSLRTSPDSCKESYIFFVFLIYTAVVDVYLRQRFLELQHTRLLSSIGFRKAEPPRKLRFKSVEPVIRYSLPLSLYSMNPIALVVVAVSFWCQYWLEKSSMVAHLLRHEGLSTLINSGKSAESESIAGWNRSARYIDLAMTVRDVDVPIPEQPGAPYPIVTKCCDIVCGFGRGSSELGIPTANVPVDQLPEVVNKLELGVYFGYAKVTPVAHDLEQVEREDGRVVSYNYGSHLEEDNGDLEVLPVVLSVGKNPFYHNDFKTVEIHILHDFKSTFYGAKIKFNILGYVRPELDYTSKEALIEDIKTDIEISKQVLDTEPYRAHMAELLK